MPFNFRQLDPRPRRLFAAGNACLAAGLLLRLFVHPSSDIANDWLHGVIGFLLGISLAINLSTLFAARRCNWLRPAEDNSPASH